MTSMLVKHPRVIRRRSFTYSIYSFHENVNRENKTDVLYLGDIL